MSAAPPSTSWADDDEGVVLPPPSLQPLPVSLPPPPPSRPSPPPPPQVLRPPAHHGSRGAPPPPPAGHQAQPQAQQQPPSAHPQGGAHPPAAPAHVVFVTGVPPGASEAELLSAFASFGATACRLARSGAFVDLPSPAAVAAAAAKSGGLTLRGKALSIEVSTPRADGAKSIRRKPKRPAHRISVAFRRAS